MLASLIVIVLGAHLVRERLSDDSTNALTWVSHTHEVRATIYELLYTLEEMQSAASGAGLDGEQAKLEHYQRARDHYTNLLGQLRELTRDSAEQQERIGMLRARTEQRVALFDAALASAGGGGLSLAPASERYPIDDIAAAIVAHEDALVQGREVRASRSRRLAWWGTLATGLVQLLLLSTVVVVADRHQRRRAIAESRVLGAIGRARLIVETVREPLAVITSDLTLLQFNQAFADLYGRAPVMGAKLGDMPAWADAALLQRLRDVATTRRELWEFETVQQVDADVPRHLVVSARPMDLADTEDLSALLTISDVTMRKRAQEQEQEFNRQLSAKVAHVTEVNRELEAFSYTVSHDLRAPLRHISGFADKLRTRAATDGDATVLHYCDVIGDASRRMSSLIDGLLSYSRLGRHALRLQAVDMQSLVEEVQGALMSGVEGRSIEWRIAPLPVVIADSAMIQLVWQNLIDNALKYSAARDEALIEIGVEGGQAGERVFWVRDNGAGFDMRYADKLFGVFQRLHKASAFPGTGIGLASVRRIIARHGGRTWAEGLPEQGATFYFALPSHVHSDP